MAKSAKNRAPARPRKPVRPILLAGGLGLIWFAQSSPGGTAAEAPAWAYGLIVGMHLFADFVGAWVGIALLQLAFALGRFGLARLRARAEQEV